MAIDLMALRKLAAEKARTGGKAAPQAAAGDADDQPGTPAAPPQRGTPPPSPFVAAAAKARERLRK